MEIMIFILGNVFWPENVQTAVLRHWTQGYAAFVEWRLVVLHTRRSERYCTEMLVRMLDLVFQRFWTGNEAFVKTSCSTALLCFQRIGKLEMLETLHRSFQDLDDLIGSRVDSLFELSSTPVASKGYATVPSNSTPKQRRSTTLSVSPSVRRVHREWQSMLQSLFRRSYICEPTTLRDYHQRKWLNSFALRTKMV